MKERIQRLKRDYPKKTAWYWLLITLLLFPLLPEYLSLILLLISFVVFKVYWSKINKKALLGETGKIFLIYMCYMIISAFWSKTHLLSALIGLLWMGCFLIYVYVANTVNTKRKLKNAITLINLSAGIIGFIAILEVVTYNMSQHLDGFSFAFPNPLYYYVNDIIYDAIPVDIVNYKFEARASSTFDNPLILATYLVTVTPFCAFGSVYFSHSKNRKISRVCFLLALGGIICTSSRGAYIAVGLSLLAILLSTSNKHLFRRIFPFIVLLAIAIPVGLVLRYKNYPKGDFLASTSKRFDIWESCFDIFLKNPVVGLGAGSDNVHTLLRDTYGIDRTHAHNLFLELLVEGGVIGGIFVVIILIMIASLLLRPLKTKDKIFHRYSALYASSLVGFITMSLFEHTLQSPKELIVFFMVLGFIEATYRIATNRQQITQEEILNYTEYESISDLQPRFVRTKIERKSRNIQPF